MLQRSKVIQSRDEWKDKAVQRATEIREQRKNVKRYQAQIVELKTQLKALEQSPDRDKKNKSTYPHLIP